MKKLLAIYAVAFIYCGSLFAQIESSAPSRHFLELPASIPDYITGEYTYTARHDYDGIEGQYIDAAVSNSSVNALRSSVLSANASYYYQVLPWLQVGGVSWIPFPCLNVKRSFVQSVLFIRI